MKKVILFLFISIFLFSFGFASTGETTTGNLEDTIKSFKASLFDEVKDKKDSLLKSYQNKISDFSGKENYKILMKLGKLDFQDVKNDIINRYFTLKQNISKEFNNYSSEYSLLEEKYSMDLISGEIFEQKKSDLKAEINSLNNKYNDFISNYLDNYNKKISSLSGEFQEKVDNNSSLLENIKKEKEKLNSITSKYKEFIQLVEKINNLYRFNTDNLYDFLDKVDDITANLLKDKLSSKINKYKNRYVNLDYYSGDINNYKNSLIADYNTNLKDYYDTLIKGFYSKEDLNYIKNNYGEIKENFYNGSGLDYNILKNKDLGNGFSKLLRKIEKVNSDINNKLSKVGTPSELSTLKKELKNKLKDFYNNKSQNYINDMEGFLEKQVELISYKTSNELDKYNNLKEEKEKIDNLTGSSKEKLNKINDFLERVEKLNKNIISDDLNSNLKEIRYELITKKVDLKIKMKNLSKYGNDYINIDKTLDNILSNLYKSYKDKNKGKEFKEKLKGAINKIDTHMEDKKISQKSKYLILKIKKSIITFLYLENN